MTTLTGAAIHAAALEYGYDNCGVIPVSDLDGYAARLRERQEKIPASKAVYANMERFTELKERYPWAKSVVICTTWLGKYRFPQSFQGKYAKVFFLAADAVPDSPRHEQKQQFTVWLQAQGLRIAGGEANAPSHILPLRYAAVAAGLGIFRKNNFFYGEEGSYYDLEGYLIDADVTYRQQCSLRPCADTCMCCQNACKTHALCAPYMMNPLSCVSFWTTFGQGQVPPHLEAGQFGTWICGCDACQDACPCNRRHDWSQGEAIAEVEELTDLLAPETLVQAPDDILREQVIPLTVDHLRPGETQTLRTCAARALAYEKSHQA